LEKYLTKNKFLLFVGLTLLSMLVRGYIFGGDSAHTFQIPILLYTSNDLLFWKDYLLGNISPDTIYYSLMSVGLIFLDIEVLFLGVYVMFSYVYVRAVFYLSKSIVKSDTVAFLNVILLMLPKLVLGRDYTFYNVTYYNIIAIPLGLFAIGGFLRGRKRRAFFISGLLLNLHALSGVSLSMIFSLIEILKILKSKIFSGRSLWEEIKKLGWYWVVWLVGAMPILVWKWWDVSRSNTNLDFDFWLNLVSVRSGHHTFVSQWGQEFWWALPILLVGILIYQSLKKDYISEKKLEILNLFFQSFAIIFLVGIIFVEIFPLKIIVQLQLFRSSVFLYTILVCLVGGWVVQKVRSGHKFNIPLVASVIAGVLTGDGKFLWLVLPVFAISQFESVSKRFDQFKSDALSFGVTMVVILGIYIWRHPQWLIRIPNIGGTNVGIFNTITLIVFVIAILVLQSISQQKFSSAKRRLAIGGIVFVFFSVFFGGLKPAQKSWHWQNHLALPWGQEAKDDWKDVELWAKSDTDVDDSFLVPPSQGGFRIYSQRPIFGDWKDGTYALFSDKFALEWWERMQVLGYWKGFEVQGDRFWNTMDEDSVIRIAQRYYQKYIVVKGEREDWGLPKAYQNSTYSVYQIF
jgi:hypothetical protein